MPNNGEKFIKIGEIRAPIIEQVRNPELVPIGYGKFNVNNGKNFIF